MTGLAAVTGATGFLGRELVQALGAAGWRVRVLARRDTDLAAEIVRGDLADAEALAALCADADVVFHVAGVVKARNLAVFEAVNVAGARRVAEAAPTTARVVLVSSLTAREPRLSHYAWSKRAGEDAMAAILGERLSIARPPAIYGPRDRELLPVFQFAAAGAPLPSFDPARIAMIHVSDAARQIAAMAELGPVRATLSDERPDGYLWSELMRTAAAAVGRTARLIPAPRFAVRALGFGGDLAALAGASPMLTSGKAREILHPDWAVAPEERSVDLPAPRYGLAEGFSATVAWYRSAAWMKH